MTVRSFENPAPAVEPRAIVIVGAGAIGLSMAVSLARRGIPSTVIEGGPHDPPLNYRQANSALSTGRKHEGIVSGRMKAYGGTTRLWGGQLVPFDAGDFAALDRDDRPLWPISYEEYRRWLSPAYDLLGVPLAARDTASIWSEATGLDLDFGRELRPTLNIWLPQPDFTRLFRDEIETSELIEVVTDARLERIVFENDTVAEIEIRSPGGRSQSLRPRKLVLAQGTIETVGTLLRVQASDPASPIAGNGNLGHWYLDHLHGLAGFIRCRNPKLLAEAFDNIYWKGFKYNVKLRSTREPHEPNLALTINPVMTLRQVAQEAAGLLKRLYRQPGSLLSSLRDGTRALVVLLPAALRYVVRRRATMVLDGGLMLGMELEQLPLRESRLFLEPGLPPAQARICIHWAVAGDEIRRVRALCEEAVAAFAANGLGEIEIDPRILAEDVAILDEFHDSNHQMGGARMAGTSGHGVVDRDARVFGTTNLYLAGGAIFPTGSFANSTLTAIALGLRLADHLAPDGKEGEQGVLLLPRLVYGTARLTGGISARSAKALVHQVLDAGVRAIDSAPPYGMGTAEDVVGAALRAHPAGGAVTLIAKAGLPRPPSSLLRSVLRAAKRALRRSAPRDLGQWQPLAPRAAPGSGRFDRETLQASAAVTARKLGRFDNLLLHECSGEQFSPEVRETIVALAAQHGARPGYGWGAHYDPALDKIFPGNFTGECGIHPAILTRAMPPPTREMLFHSIAATAEWLVRTDPDFAPALEAAAELIPADDRGAARIAAAYAIAAIRAPDARLVFSSTDPARLASLLAALKAIDSGQLLPRIAALLDIRSGSGIGAGSDQQS